MKKIILIILLSFSLISCKTNYITCFIGNEFVSKEIISNSETDFLFKRIESKSLLKIIEENMKNNNSDTNVVKLISKSSKIILSIGLFDLLKCVCLEEGKLIFNYKTSILELFELNLFNIIEQIYEYNPKVNLTLVSLYNPYVNSHDNFYFSLNIGVDKFNQVIKSFAIENGISFYDISGYSTSIKEFNQFKEDIQKEILKGLISV